MLTTLRIQNLILIEKGEIHFGPGLNILTGETGAGKSAVLAAVRLLCGERADHQLIRKGASFAVVEAVLSSSTIIRREIYASGKNRCFIDEAQVSLSQLKQCIGSNLERIDQSSDIEERKSLDAFADVDLSEFSQLYAKMEEQKARLEELLSSRERRDRELKEAEEAFESIRWEAGEETKLTEEHHLLTHGQELMEKVSSVSSALNEVSQFKRLAANLDLCVRFDPKISPLAEQLRSAALELDDVAGAIDSYLSRLEIDPHRLQWVEERLGAIESIKRRFGENPKEKLGERINFLTAESDELASIEKSDRDLTDTTSAMSLSISKKRKTASLSFAKRIQEELQSLNLPHAKFLVQVESKPLSANGEDEISFLFSANPGLPPIPLRQCASGGEQSRILLAIKTVLAEKEGRSCLVFDEVDSNVGGQTAAVLGEKLKKLSENRQVICVTHFVQVAKYATDHFLVSKSEREGTAYTAISHLIASNREKEYSRMLGNS